MGSINRFRSDDIWPVLRHMLIRKKRIKCSLLEFSVAALLVALPI
jgi:hypothetical protein